MTLTLARLQQGRLREAAEVLARSLYHDPYSEFFFPDEDGRLPALRSVERAVLSDAWPFHEVHGVLDGSDLVGVTAWLPPGKHRQGPVRQLRQLPRFLRVAIHFPASTANAIRVADAERRSHPGVPHWWLVVVGVDPEVHGRGIGGQMVEAFVARTERDGAPGYLRTTNEANLSFYARFGFEVVEELQIREDVPPMWLLWRASPE